MNNIHEISDQPLTFERVMELMQKDYHIKLSNSSKNRIVQCRTYLDQKIKAHEAPLYGINTGFGYLCHQTISKEHLETLQENLVKSHACGVGMYVPNDIVKLMLFLKVQSLSYGHSGVQLETVQRLIDFFNHKVYPLVYEYGSLGASGDLAPLAHLSLPLIGLGEVHHEGKELSGEQFLHKMKWGKLKFKAKEGLALLNGTQFMSSYGVLSLIHAEKLLQLADIIGAISLEAFNGRVDPFNPLIHQIRRHKGQLATAKKIMNLLEGSEITNQVKPQVQDPYSFRCIPQVHGASKETIEYVKDIFITEINGVTDNPNIFPDHDEIISGGNFHGQPLALALDFMAIAMAEIGNISERRTYQLISGVRDLPNFLTANPGLNSGLMIPQYTAASLVSSNKQLCTPASVDSIVSSNGQEDHVSMGANAATKAYKVIENSYAILAIELLTATQALHFRKPLRSSFYIESFVNKFRSKVSFIEHDRVLHKDINAAIDFIKQVEL